MIQCPECGSHGLFIPASKDLIVCHGCYSVWKMIRRRLEILPDKEIRVIEEVVDAK